MLANQFASLLDRDLGRFAFDDLESLAANRRGGFKNDVPRHQRVEEMAERRKVQLLGRRCIVESIEKASNVSR